MKKILVALGCSWAVGAEIELEFPNDNMDVVRAKYRWAEVLRQKMGYDEHVVFGQAGGSNEYAIRTAYDGISQFIEDGHKVFLVFGVASAWRGELFDVEANCYVGFMYSSIDYFQPPTVPIATKKFLNDYKLHTSNTEALRQKQNIALIGFHSFLAMNNIEHIFFKVYNPYYPSPLCDRIPDKNYIWRQQRPISETIPHSMIAPGTHPTVAGHRLIADALYTHIVNGEYNV
jgi:hypothetical protein